MLLFTNLKILPYFNIVMIIMLLMPMLKPYIEDFSAVQEETNILQEAMEEEIDETVSSLDEKDDEESEDKGGRAD